MLLKNEKKIHRGQSTAIDTDDFHLQLWKFGIQINLNSFEWVLSQDTDSLSS